MAKIGTVTEWFQEWYEVEVTGVAGEWGPTKTPHGTTVPNGE